MSVVLEALRAHLPSATRLTRAELAVLRRLRQSAHRLRRGDELLVQGRCHDGIFLLMEGYALRYRVLRDGRRQALDVYLPGDTLGGPSAFLGAALNTATALSRAAVAQVSSEQIAGACERFPHLTLALLRSATSETARIGEHLVDVGRRGVCERVAHFALELAARLEAVGLGTRDEFTIPITQVQLADLLGLSIPHTNRVLRRLRERRLLDVTGAHFRIRDRQGLCDLADFSDSYLGLQRHARTALAPPRAIVRSEAGTPIPFKPNLGPSTVADRTSV